jgi:hypothetical protein
MRRWLPVLALVLAVAAGGVYWLYTSLDTVVKAAIEHFGPDLVGAPVRLAQVQLSAKDGRGTLRGLEVGNPQGYSAPRSLRAGTIAVAVDPRTIPADVVVIREILVEAPEITYELRDGRSNLEAIQRHIENHARRASAGSQGNAAAAGGSGRRYIVDRVTIRGARVTMTNAALKGGGLVFALPDVVVRDIGRREGGVSAAQAASVVTAALVARVAQKILTSADLLRRGGVDGALDALRGLLR